MRKSTQLVWRPEDNTGLTFVLDAASSPSLGGPRLGDRYALALELAPPAAAAAAAALPTGLAPSLLTPTGLLPTGGRTGVDRARLAGPAARAPPTPGIIFAYPSVLCRAARHVSGRYRCRVTIEPSRARPSFTLRPTRAYKPFRIRARPSRIFSSSSIFPAVGAPLMSMPMRRINFSKALHTTRRTIATSISGRYELTCGIKSMCWPTDLHKPRDGDNHSRVTEHGPAVTSAENQREVHTFGTLLRV